MREVGFHSNLPNVADYLKREMPFWPSVLWRVEFKGIDLWPYFSGDDWVETPEQIAEYVWDRFTDDVP
jgi:hypothetical protein